MRKKKAKSSWAAILMAFICLGVAAYFGGKIAYQEMQYKAGDDVYDHIADIATKDPDADHSDTTESDETEGKESEEITRMVDVDFAALKEVNPDVKAWLYCLDTVINYPVCQGEDKIFVHKLVKRNGQEMSRGHPLTCQSGT